MMIPSNHPGEGAHVKSNLKRLESLKELETKIKQSKQNGDFKIINDKILSQKLNSQKKPSSISIRKNLKNLFSAYNNASTLENFKSNSFTTSSMSSSLPSLSSTTKFTKNVKKGSAYIVMIIHDKENVLTSCGAFPMVELCEGYETQNINNDLQFLIKLSMNWTEVDSFKGIFEQSPFFSNNLKFRYQLITTIRQLQTLINMINLGQVYHQYFVINESVFFVLCKKYTNLSFSSSKFNNLFKLGSIEKILMKCEKLKLNKKHKDLEINTLKTKLKEILEFEESCERVIGKGFYVAYLNAVSNIEQLKLILQKSVPNMIPCKRIRQNPHLSKFELDALNFYNLEYHRLQAYISRRSESSSFLALVVESIHKLANELGFRSSDVEHLRIMTNDLITVNEDITLLLVFPPSDQMCVISDPEKYGPLAENKYLYLPIQVFEAINLNYYNSELLRLYSKISIDLELEYFTALQYQREAFLNDEINKAKQIVDLISKYQKTLEETWKKSRWIIEAINVARDKVASMNSRLISVREFNYNLENIKQIENREDISCKKPPNHASDPFIEASKLNEPLKRPVKNALTSRDDSANRNHATERNAANFCQKCTTKCPNKAESDHEEYENDFPMQDNSIVNKSQTNRRHDKLVLLSKLYITNTTTTNSNSSSSSSSLTGPLKQGDECETVKFQALRSNLIDSLFQTNNHVGKLPNYYINQQELIEKHKNQNPIFGNHQFISSSSSTSSSSLAFNNDDYLQTSHVRNKNTCHSNDNSLSKEFKEAVNRHSFSNTILVRVAFQTSLKIETNFECTINSYTRARDVILHILAKLDVLVNQINLINKESEYVNDKNKIVDFDQYYNGEDRYENQMNGFHAKAVEDGGLIKKFNKNFYTNSFTARNHMFCLVVIVDQKEHIIDNSFQIAFLQKQLLNGYFYLRSLKDDDEAIKKYKRDILRYNKQS